MSEASFWRTICPVGTPSQAQDNSDLPRNCFQSAVKLKWVRVSCYKMTLLDLILPMQKFKLLRTLHLEGLQHPSYLLDLALGDYHILGTLRTVMGGKAFRSEVQPVVHEQLRRSTKIIFWTGTHTPYKCSGTCTRRNEDNVENWCTWHFCFMGKQKKWFSFGSPLSLTS